MKTSKLNCNQWASQLVAFWIPAQQELILLFPSPLPPDSPSPIQDCRLLHPFILKVLKSPCHDHGSCTAPRTGGEGGLPGWLSFHQLDAGSKSVVKGLFHLRRIFHSNPSSLGLFLCHHSYCLESQHLQ